MTASARAHVIGVGSVSVLLALWLAAPARAEQRALRTFTAADGLPHDQVKTLLSDSRGFLWLGTEEGLARFDGASFATYGPAEGLPHRSVRDLLEDRTGRYWLATAGGVYRFTPGPREMLHVPQYAISGAPVAAPAAKALLEDRAGAIWCGTNQGLFRARLDASGRWRLDEIPIGLELTEHGTIVRALLEARDGTLWIGTGSGLYRRTVGGRVDRFTPDDGLPDREIGALARDAAGHLWVGTRFGLAELDISGTPARPSVIRTYTERDGLPSGNIKALSISTDGDIWVGLTRGVVRLRGRPRVVDDVLPGSVVRDLAADSAGNLWIASDTGAMRLARGGLVTYGKDDGLVAAGVRSLFEDRRGRVCATVRADGYRLQCFDGRRFSMTRVPVHDAWNLMWGWLHLTVQDRAGAWWIPTADGLYHFPAGAPESLAASRPSAIYGTRDGLEARHVFRLFADSRGDLWMSTFADRGNGLCRRDRASGRIRCYGAAEGLPRPTPAAYAFAEDRAGHVWVGFEDGHLARCDGTSAAPRCTVVPQDGARARGVLRDLHVDRRGRLWIASSNGGAARIDDPTAPAPRTKWYTQADGLSSQTIWAIAEDDGGRVYLAGGRGIDRLDPRTGEIVYYSEADGLARGEVRDALRAADGTLWFAAAEGLSRLVPHDQPIQEVQPVRIMGLRIAGMPQPVSDAGARAIDGLRLAPHTRSLAIDFVSPRLGMGQDVRYQYRVEGVDAQWQPSTTQRSVTYAGLPVGTHRFAVRAISADGRATSPPAFVAFTVARPLWQRWWFLTLIAAAGAAAISAWLRVRVAKTVEIERVRTRIAGDLHDEIGAGLSEIAILSEVAQQRMPPTTEPVTQSLSVIATTSRELVDAMSDIVWAINPQKDSLGNLTRRMRIFATDLLTARGICFRFEADARHDDRPIGADIRRHVFLIFKECLNNAVRHARCRHLAIELGVQHDVLVLRVADDGHGLQGGERPYGSGEGHGLSSMHARARDLGGTLTVRAEAGRGTTLTLCAPLGHRVRRRHLHRYVGDARRSGA